MSISSKQGTASRASDDDAKTSVKVGMSEENSFLALREEANDWILSQL